MNSKLKYWIAAICSDRSGWSWLGSLDRGCICKGSSLWILRGALAFIGLARFIVLIWWFIVKDKQRGEWDAAGPGGDEIDALIREAETRLQASKLGKSASVGNLPLYPRSG